MQRLAGDWNMHNMDTGYGIHGNTEYWIPWEYQDTNMDTGYGIHGNTEYWIPW